MSLPRFAFVCPLCPWTQTSRHSTEEERDAALAEHRAVTGHRRLLVNGLPPPTDDDGAYPEPLVTVPNAEVGDPNSPRWRLAAALVSRTRTMRLEHASWCMDHAGYYTDEQFQRVLGIYRGDGDPILQKCIEHGIDPE